MNQEISLDLLVGRPVLTLAGARLGRIQEIVANDQAEITEFHVGKQALLERLSALGLFSRPRSGYIIRWNQLDLSDPTTPRLTCDVSEIQPL